MTDLHPAGSDERSPAARAEDIFRRYPDITAKEADEALAFLKKGRHLDVGFVTGIPELRGSIDAFRRQHRRALGVGVIEMLVFTATFFALIGGTVWLLAK